MKKPKGVQDRLLVACLKCGEHAALSSREFKRDFNLIFTCAGCGFTDLVANPIRKAVYDGLQKTGHAVGAPPTPLRIEPVAIFTAEEGFELVARRNKQGGERIYRRRIKKP